MPRGQNGFGSYRVNFSQCADVKIGEVFGLEDLKPSEVAKKIWAFIKAQALAKKQG